MRVWRTRPGRCRAGLVVLALVAVCLGGCTVGDVRRDPPRRDGVGSVAGPDGAGVVERRAAPVAVPPTARLQQIEFVDAGHGYALFVAADPPGPASPPGSAEADPPASVLYRTVDGGRSWHPLRHLRLTGHPQVYAGNGVLVIFVDPDHWYVSTDSGWTFTHQRSAESPPARYRTEGRFHLCCDRDERRTVREWIGDQRRVLPAQPPLPVVDTLAYHGDRLVVAGWRDGRLRVSVSEDRGRSWQAPTGLGLDGEWSRVWAAVAPDGDAWLLGQAGDPTTFPALWRRDGPGAGWLMVRPVDAPERFTSAVPLGAGLLAVTGPGGPGLVGQGRYRDLPWPVGDRYLRMLPDGTLFAADPADGTAWLGIGRGAERHWRELRLRRG